MEHAQIQKKNGTSETTLYPQTSSSSHPFFLVEANRGQGLP